MSLSGFPVYFHSNFVDFRHFFGFFGDFVWILYRFWRFLVVFGFLAGVLDFWMGRKNRCGLESDFLTLGYPPFGGIKTPPHGGGVIKEQGMGGLGGGF